jgi:hypothetical protein
MYNFELMDDPDNLTFTYQHTYYRSTSFIVKVNAPVAAIIIKKISFKLNPQVIP